MKRSSTMLCVAVRFCPVLFYFLRTVVLFVLSVCLWSWCIVAKRLDGSRFKMPLRIEVGLGPVHIVLGGNPAAPTERGTAAAYFLAYIYCGWTVAYLNNCWSLVVLVISFFTARAMLSAVLGVVILSVRLSVRLSHTCFATNPKNLPAIFLYHTKGQSF